MLISEMSHAMIALILSTLQSCDQGGGYWIKAVPMHKTCIYRTDFIGSLLFNTISFYSGLHTNKEGRGVLCHISNHK